MSGGCLHADVAIVGAGIGGLTAALSLHEHGFRVQVVESVARVQPLGVGINVLPHAVRELGELGLQGDLERGGVRCERLRYHSKRGQPIWSEPRGMSAGYLWPQVSIHRGELQDILLRAALERIGQDRFAFGAHASRVETLPGGGARLHCDARGNGERDLAFAAKVVVAADGIHSALRRALYPDEGPPRWNGAVMWRGIAQAAAVDDGHTMIMAGHTRQKFVCYPIRTAERVGELPLINFIAELRFDSRELSEREDWSKPGRLEDFLPAFESWRFDWLDVPALIRAADRTWVYPMVDRDPLPSWTHGPVTLLGDAAHPMYPIGSNGASQAILDARVLTGCLRQYGDDLARGLARYEAIRRPATAEIVHANRGMGPELPMQLVEDRAPNGFARLEDVISSEELRAIADRYKSVAGFAVSTLNSRPSLAEKTV
jgi:2-polyprenyl-6-methoxyphenol hydroxylase-like FAD-dependent oxidoreductase